MARGHVLPLCLLRNHHVGEQRRGAQVLRLHAWLLLLLLLLLVLLALLLVLPLVLLLLLRCLLLGSRQSARAPNARRLRALAVIVAPPLGEEPCLLLGCEPA
jgi:uncharacterized BrkB/YihY/UPF0761 family membrane protein